MALGDVRSDLIDLLATVLGRAKAEEKVAEIESLVQSKAAEGTNTAIDKRLPEIKATVREETGKFVTPLFLGATVVGAIAILIGVAALSRGRQ